jgi:hypothetical protein
MRSYRASMSRSLARRGCANAMRMQRGWRRGRLGKEATGSHPDDEAAIAGSGSAIFDFRPGLKAIAQSCFCCTLDDTRGFRLHGPSRLGMPDGLGWKCSVSLPPRRSTNPPRRDLLYGQESRMCFVYVAIRA